MMLYAGSKYLEHSPGSELNLFSLNNAQWIMKAKESKENKNLTTEQMKSRTTIKEMNDNDEWRAQINK